MFIAPVSCILHPPVSCLLHPSSFRGLFAAAIFRNVSLFNIVADLEMDSPVSPVQSVQSRVAPTERKSATQTAVGHNSPVQSVSPVQFGLRPFVGPRPSSPRAAACRGLCSAASAVHHSRVTFTIQESPSPTPEMIDFLKDFHSKRPPPDFSAHFFSRSPVCATARQAAPSEIV